MPGIFGFRTLHDTEGMIAWAQDAERAAIIGGGLLGLEAARGLQARGLEVDVIHRSSYLMNLQLDREPASILHRAMIDMGIRVHLDRATSHVVGNGRVRALGFDDGSELGCDMVVVSAGVRPNVDVAARSGLPVERAIVVDDQMRVDGEDDIYAVGECAQHRGLLYGLVAPLWEQATVLAEHLSGRNQQAAYHGSKLATKLKVSGVELATMGLVAPEHPDDEVVRFSEPRRGVYKSVIVRNGKLVGATLLGDLSKVSFLMQAFDRGSVLPEERVSLLFDLGAPPAAVSIGELPDDAQICNCNGVSKGDIRACAAGGVRTLRGVMDATRAGSGCGSCKAQVQEVLEWAVGGAVEEDPAADYYVPGIPLTKPALMAAVRERGVRSVSALFAEFAGGEEDAKAKPALASLLRLVWAGDYDDERDARFINDRVHANIQKDGTFSVVPRISGGVTNADQLRRIADVADRFEIPMVKITGGQRIDLLGVAKEDLPAVWRELGMPSGYAYGKTFRTVKTCVGIGVLPLRAGRQHDARDPARGALQGPGEPGQAQARRGRLPAQLLGGDGQGRRVRRRRGRALGDVRRRRRGRAHPQGRPPVHARHARRGDAARRPLHAVLPRAREVARADLPLHGARRARRGARGRGRRPRRRGRAAGRRDPGRGRRYRDPWLEADDPATPSQFASVVGTAS